MCNSQEVWNQPYIVSLFSSSIFKLQLMIHFCNAIYLNGSLEVTIKKCMFHKSVKWTRSKYQRSSDSLGFYRFFKRTLSDRLLFASIEISNNHSRKRMGTRCLYLVESDDITKYYYIRSTRVVSKVCLIRRGLGQAGSLPSGDSVTINNPKILLYFDTL